MCPTRCTLAYLLETESEDGEEREAGRSLAATRVFKSQETLEMPQHRERDGAQMVQPLA